MNKTETSFYVNIGAQVFDMRIVFLVFEALYTTMYFLIFGFALIETGYSYGFISWSIASTTLVGVFIGPKFGFAIDGARNKYLLLFSAILICNAGLAVQYYSLLTGKTHLFIMGLAMFAIAYYPCTLIISQYISPYLKKSTNKSYVIAARWQSLGGFLAACIGLFVFYTENALQVFYYTCIFGIITLSFAFALVFFPQKTTEQEKTDKPNTFTFVFRVITRNVALLIPTLGIVLAIDAVDENIHGMLDSMEGIFKELLFFAAIFRGVFSLIGVQIYDKYLLNLRRKTTLSILLIVFFASNLCTLTVLTLAQNQILLNSGIVLAFILGTFAISWWGILYLSWVRDITEDGEYASTAAAIRVIRSAVTFIAIGLVGNLLDIGGATTVIIFGLSVLIVLIIISTNVWRVLNFHEKLN